MYLLFQNEHTTFDFTILLMVCIENIFHFYGIFIVRGTSMEGTLPPKPAEITFR